MYPQAAMYPHAADQPSTRMVAQQRYELVQDPKTGNKTRKPVMGMVPNMAYQDSSVSPFEGSQLDNEIQQLAAQYRNAKPGSKESISQSLNQKVTELFDARHEVHASRVAALRKEVEQTQELLVKRLQLKSKIVERRVKELTGQQDELSWNAAVPNVSSSVPVPSQSDAFIYSPSSYQPMPAPSNINPLDFQIQSTPNYGNGGAYGANMQVPNATGFIYGTNNPPIPPMESIPLSPVPLNLPENSVSTVPVSDNPVNGNPANVTSLESQRSFMTIGFKLKNLYRELEDERKNSSDATLSKDAKALQNAIDENKALWEFEKSALESALETAKSEYEIVEKQLEHELTLVNATKKGEGTFIEITRAEVAKSETERQLHQLRSRVATLKKSIIWMDDFLGLRPSAN